MTFPHFVMVTDQYHVDPHVSSGGSYRAETTQLSEDQGILELQTTIYSTGESNPVFQFEWQRYTALGDLDLGGEWLTDELLLITTELARGPLLVDLRGLPAGEPRLIEVAPELFGVPGVVERDPENFTGLVAYGAGHPRIPGEFHLLLAGSWIEGQFPPVQLYHSETGEVETFAQTYLDGIGFRPDPGWVVLVSRDSSSGSETATYWSRAIDSNVDGVKKLATGGYLFFSPAGDQFMHTSQGTVVERRSFPGNIPLNSWNLSPYQPGWVFWSPDGQAAAVVSYPTSGAGEYSLFVLVP